MKPVDLDEIRRVREEADCLCDATEVDAALTRLASDITARLHDKNPLVYTVMNGGLVLAGRLLPRLPFPLEVGYLHATRYGHALHGTLQSEAEPRKDYVITVGHAPLACAATP